MTEATRILNAIEAGDPKAAAQLWPLVYDELRRLAAQKLAQEKPGHTLQPTALVHEAYLRLVGAPSVSEGWANRKHFFAAAAEAMRRILIENARRKQSQKHGGGMNRQALEPAQLPAPEADANLLALDEALGKLANSDPQAAELIKLRFFAGLTSKQAADVMGVSPRTADFIWAYARAWLRTELQADIIP
jgi:RNA polymerase sigma factor (TIGR02999 family)